MAYSFSHIFAPDHFVTRYIRYAAMRTDAPHDYHEAAACWLLACACHNVKGQLVFYPRGLSTNLYLMMVGLTTRDRKSTSLEIPGDLLTHSGLDYLLPERMTTESFIEQMAMKVGGAGAWCIDEFSALFRAMNHKGYMADMREVLMELYSGKDYKYARHSKRIKGGTKEDDTDIISNPHLCILAATTPTIFSCVTQIDLESGLLPRFGIVMPTERPERKSLMDSNRQDTGVAQERNDLAFLLKGIHASMENSEKCYFNDQALGILDEYAKTIDSDGAEEDTQESFMRRRFPAMAIKLSMLALMGSPQVFPADGRMMVDADAAVRGVALAQKWQGFAEKFAGRVAENEMEAKTMRFIQFMEGRHEVPRETAAQAMRLDALSFNRILDTAVQRGQVAPLIREGSKQAWLRYTGNGGNGKATSQAAQSQPA